MEEVVHHLMVLKCNINVTLENVLKLEPNNLMRENSVLKNLMIAIIYFVNILNVRN